MTTRLPNELEEQVGAKAPAGARRPSTFSAICNGADMPQATRYPPVDDCKSRPLAVAKEGSALGCVNDKIHVINFFNFLHTFSADRANIF